MFVQWVQCSVVFVCGWAINVVRGLPPVNMVAAIGGVLYATGNVASVPLVSEMGSGLVFIIFLPTITWGYYFSISQKFKNHFSP
jgi:hypothetical protein